MNNMPYFEMQRDPMDDYTSYTLKVSDQWVIKNQYPDALLGWFLIKLALRFWFRKIRS